MMAPTISFTDTILHIITIYVSFIILRVFFFSFFIKKTWSNYFLVLVAPILVPVFFITVWFLSSQIWVAEVFILYVIVLIIGISSFFLEYFIWGKRLPLKWKKWQVILFILLSFLLPGILVLPFASIISELLF